MRLLPVGLQDSHQDGGRVFVIDVADPRTRQSYTIAGGGTVLVVTRWRRVAATVSRQLPEMEICDTMT
jgi:hypothetical protein